MSAATTHLKDWLMKNGAAPYIEEAARTGRPDAALVTLRAALEKGGMTPVMSAGLSRAFAALVRERLANGAP